MGRTEREFMAGANAAGYSIQEGRTLPWLSVHGHADPALKGSVPAEVLSALRKIFLTLGGDEALLAGKRRTGSPRPDGFYDGRVLEVDEIQHFTSARLTALELYPSGAHVGFDIQEYRTLCRRWAPKGGDRYRAPKQTVEFPWAGGRRAQRAYFDAVRDLVAPHVGFGPTIRVPAPECDPAVALARFRKIAERS